MDEPSADPHGDAVLERLVAWGRSRDDVRAIVLTSGRARPGGPVDALSDHDVIVAVDDPAPFAASTAWHEELGPVLLRWGDEDVLEGRRVVFRGAVYEDHTKIDFTIWPAELLEVIAGLDVLPDELDAGYRVLLDDRGATAGWLPPSFRAYVPARPSAEEYRALVEEFWWGVSYVAKALWRGELIFANSFVLGYDLRLVTFARMLEWWIEIRHDWSLPLGLYGRQLDRHLPADLREELLATSASPTVDATWSALDRTCELFRRIAVEVGDALGMDYPWRVDEGMAAHVADLRGRPQNGDRDREERA